FRVRVPAVLARPRALLLVHVVAALGADAIIAAALILVDDFEFVIQIVFLLAVLVILLVGRLLILRESYARQRGGTGERHGRKTRPAQEASAIQPLLFELFQDGLVHGPNYNVRAERTRSTNQRVDASCGCASTNAVPISYASRSRSSRSSGGAESVRSQSSRSAASTCPFAKRTIASRQPWRRFFWGSRRQPCSYAASDPT